MGSKLKTRASRIVRDALADPDFEALPKWDGEDPADDYFTKQVAGLDPRRRAEIERQLDASALYQKRREEALEEAQRIAGEIYQGLPPQMIDQLVLVTRKTDREALLADRIGQAPSRRRGWIAYFAQRFAREAAEEAVLNRYSAATKILIGRGWSKTSVSQALGVTAGRVNSLLDREAETDLDDSDPLCQLVPELRGSGSERRLSPKPSQRSQPKPLSRMTVAEKVDLAAETQDPAILLRLADAGSRRISEALIDRYTRLGDVGDDILLAILGRYPGPWMHEELSNAHRHRPLPTMTALALAETHPRILIDADDNTARQAARLGREDFDAVLALRDSDVEAMKLVLASDPASARWQQLVGLLVERPLGSPLVNRPDLIVSLLQAAERADDPEEAAALRLVACQNDDVLADHIRANADTGSARMPATDIVKVALGSYHRSGLQSRQGVLPSAQALWAGADLTLEHTLARSVVADRGEDVTTLETDDNLYVVSASAIRCFNRSRSPSYTYVHLHLTSATEHHVPGFTIRLPSSLPALAYHREMAKHPNDLDGPEVEVIAWPLPFQPAIYSLDVGLGDTAGYFAVSDGRTAIIEDL